jgi:hypothetical protein
MPPEVTRKRQNILALWLCCRDRVLRAVNQREKELSAGHRAEVTVFSAATGPFAVPSDPAMVDRTGPGWRIVEKIFTWTGDGIHLAESWCKSH